MNTPTPPPKYENNPFHVGLNGLNLLITSAQSVAILLAVVAGLSSLTGLFGGPSSSEDPEASQKTSDAIRNFFQSDPEVLIKFGIFTLGILLLFSLISTFISGIADYTAAHLAKGEKVTLSVAAKTVFVEFPGYFWVKIIIFVKLLLWSLLLIIPGFIMSVRYSLAGVAYFADNKQGSEAVKHSLTLTKDAWLTTYGSQQFWNLITFTIAPLVIRTSANTILYRQFSAIKGKKPKAHTLSWLTLFLPILGVLLFVGLIALIVVIIIVAA